MNGAKFKQDKEIILLGSLVILGRLGQGSTSHVFKTQSIKTKQLYAMKVIDKTNSQYNYQAIMNEVKIHEQLSHRHISHFIAHLEDAENHYLLTEYCEGGQITKILLQEPNQPKIIQIAYSLGLALQYLHDQANISHGDLKLSNVLVKKSSIKLCDFGFSQQLQGILNNSSFGTLVYMSPETMLTKKRIHHKEADIWAYGIIILTLMLRKKPYLSQSYKQLRKQIIQCRHVQPEQCQFSKDIIKFVKYVLNPCVEKRPKIAQILQHNIFKNIKKQINNCLIRVPSTEEFQTPIKKQLQSSIKNDMIQTIKRLPEEENDFDKTVYKNQSLKKILAYSLKPQIHKTKSEGEIQILENRNVQVKVKDVKYVIDRFGESLTLYKKNTKRTYSFEEIKENQKIKNLYRYGKQVVNFLKKNQGIKEVFFKEGYFWSSKPNKLINFQHKTGYFITHNLQRNTIQLPDKQVSFQGLKGLEREEIRVFLQGEKYLLSKLQHSL